MSKDMNSLRKTFSTDFQRRKTPQRAGKVNIRLPTAQLVLSVAQLKVCEQQHLVERRAPPNTVEPLHEIK